MENYFLYFCSILLATLFLYSFLRKIKNNKLKLPPSPRNFPLLGCLPQMLMNKPVFRWIDRFMDENKTNVACFRFAKVHVFVVKDPKLACEFLKKEDSNFASRPICMSSDITSDGFLTVVMSPFSDQWKKMRKMLTTEMLSPARHRWLQDKRVDEADHLVRYVYNQCLKKGVVNIRNVTHHYCGNFMRRLLLNKRFFGKGAEDGGPGIEEIEHVQSLFTILELVYGFCVSDYLPFLRGYDLDGHEKLIKKCNQIVKKYQDPIIEERIKQWEDGSRKEEEDMLDVFIRLKDPSTGAPLLSVDEIKAQITELMLAVVDNPSNAVEWALAEMINKPELLEKATKEIDQVVGKDRLVNESDLPLLNYVKACIKEAFRLHPIAPFNLPHVAIVDTVIGGYTIPKGSHVLLSRPGLGRNPDFWDEPLKFIPERHLKEKDVNVILNDSEFKILSFGNGKRGCVAVALGTNVTTMLFARLLQGFTWSKPPNVSKIELDESKNDLFRATPLVLSAKPRLDRSLYPTA